MNKKYKIPNYVKFLIKNHLKITSGRKNFDQHNYRIIKTIQIIKKYFKKKEYIKLTIEIVFNFNPTNKYYLKYFPKLLRFLFL